jgi:hypothetical protein
LAVVAEHDGRTEPQRVKLPRGLQDARLLAFGKNDPLRMPLQFFDDVADETHGDRLALRNLKLQNQFAVPKILLVLRSRPRPRF